MPLSEAFAGRLLPLLPELVAGYGTPFHIYDQQGIVDTYRDMVGAFGTEPYRQYFAVKALPNPAVLSTLLAEGSGLDCASPVELELAERLGAGGDDVVFTSNNTTVAEYEQALKAGAVITFDDRTMLDKAERLPEVVAFRVAPHGVAARSTLMGSAAHSKFGVPVDELADTYRQARGRGARRFGIHGRICASELDLDRAVRAAVDVVELAARLAADTGIELEYVNIGGGLGIPYRPGEQPIDFRAYAAAILAARRRVFGHHRPRVVSEFGRYVTGPHGVLVTRVTNRCRKGQDVVGVDASMSALMRPGYYGAYHHISLPFADGRPETLVDVVGSLCENNDKFGIDRLLPAPVEGDVALVHDTGAHGHAMGFTYNGRLRPAELMLTTAGEVVEIRRAETFDDYLATARWTPAPIMEVTR
ncbi:diaminopimelate decarboxylase [Micromonospora fluostatini]|uniref:Diaminopimelate decarboxylase n=1 Tax=Micromonospora fluostatini TaxID=1629071 RepID=A0ABY2DK21_9ACTN|nr:diaminopimelate decarboxylase [Micromonospora fluostatini]